jgi:ribosomal protein S18 acetylase RimI-like enzyme
MTKASKKVQVGKENGSDRTKAQIRKVQSKEDLKEVEVLAEIIWNEHYTPIIGREQVEYMLQNFQSVPAMEKQIAGGMEYFLIQSGQAAVGYLAFQARKGELFLSKIYLISEFRGRGLGRAGMDFAQAMARERGLSFISLTVNRNNTDSIRAYERLGFVKEGTLVTDIGHGYVMDDFVMRKTL